MAIRFIPHKYQERAVKFLLENPESGLFLAPGLGKTSITLSAYKILRAKGFVHKMLVIAPLRPCYSVWPKEVKKWENFAGFSVGILHGKDKDKVLKENHDIYVVNPEGMRWLFTETSKRGKWPWDWLVIDESSKFKSTNTQRFKTIKPHLIKFKRRTILTGSPTPNSLLDLFGQMYCMDLGKALGQYITHYRNMYFRKTGFGGYTYMIVPGADKAIYDHIAPRVLRMSDEDYLDMPDLIFEDIEVELPKDAMKIYKQLEHSLMLEFTSGKVVAANAAVATMQCRQIANGGIYIDGNERTAKVIHEAKSEALKDLVEELEGQPALVAYEFLHDLERIKKVLGRATPYIGGGVSPKRSDAIIAQWNKGELPVLLGHPMSMSHGLNLQEAGRAVIFHSLIYSYEQYDQLIRRVWRQGQKSKVFVYRIVAKDTVDEAILKVLTRKEAGQNALFNALSDYFH